MLQKFIGEEQTTFEPEAVEILHRAYSEVCAKLGIFAGDMRGQEAVAMRVIDLAKSGVLNVDALRDRVLAEIGAVAAVGIPVPPASHLPPSDGMR